MISHSDLTEYKEGSAHWKKKEGRGEEGDQLEKGFRNVGMEKTDARTDVGDYQEMA